MTISTSIDSYIYLAIHKCSVPHIKVIYSDLELEKDINKIKHYRIREALKYFEIYNNIEISSFSDITHKGSGLGSSSSFLVGLVYGLHYLKYNKLMATYDLANLASYIEINLCNEPIGKQDHFIAAYGGFKKCFYDIDGVSIYSIENNELEKLQNNLYMFNTGYTRLTSDILGQHVKKLNDPNNQKKIELTRRLVDIAITANIYLNKNKIDDFGALLDETWQLKKKTFDGVSNPSIDNFYEEGRNAGALGGKLLGAGGGGYLLFYCPEKNKNKFLNTMQKLHLIELPFNFTKQGSTLTLC